MNKYKKLVNLGLPSCWDKNGNLIPQEAYEEMITMARNNATKLEDLEGTFKEKAIVDKLKDDFELLWSQKYYSKGIYLPMRNLQNWIWN